MHSRVTIKQFGTAIGHLMAVAQSLNQLFQRRGRFIVVGLTGRTGSGCTSAANLLARSFPNLPLDAVASPLTSPEQRKYRIVYEYAQQNWEPFIHVSVTAVILTFALEADRIALEQFLKTHVKERELSPTMAEIERVSKAWTDVQAVVKPGEKKQAQETQAFLSFWTSDLSNLLLVLRKALGAAYSTVFQTFGDNLRSSGLVLDNKFDPDTFLTLPTRVAEIVVALRELQISRHAAARIVVDALRNPFEIEYFRERFASFYLVAITTPDEHRRSRLSVRSNLSQTDIKKLDGKEYPAENKPLAGSAQFVSQNIQACLGACRAFPPSASARMA